MTLEQAIRRRLQDRPLLLMTHAVVGHPSLDDNWRMLEAMQEAAIDLVELQLPFSEPIADGPVFNRANQEALRKGLHRDDYFHFMERASARFDFPILFMGYYNSVYTMGHAAFCARLAAAGGRGFIIADLPPEQFGDLDDGARQHGLAPIHLMTPVNSPRRLQEIAAGAAGFIYCVARKGVTGRATALDTGVGDYIKRCRAVTDLPVALGFGIRSAADVVALRGIADIAIVGTACLDAWERQGPAGYAELLAGLHDACAA